MMEYRFRGFDAVGEKGWVYGDLVHNLKVTKERDVQRTMVGGYEVFPDSVGLFTGRKDMKGVDVYAGDILRISYNGEVLFNSSVVWVDRMAGFYMDEGNRCYSPIPDSYMIEVIGNIFERDAK